MLTPSAHVAWGLSLALLMGGGLLGCDDGDGDEPPRIAPMDGGVDADDPFDMALDPDDAALDGAPRDGATPDLDVPVLPDLDVADRGLPIDFDGELPDGDVPDGDRPDFDLPDGELPDFDLPDFDLPDGEPVDMLPPDAGLDPRCAPWDAVDDDELPQALHAALHDSYRPIDPEPDRGGTLNRYTTARFLMFNDVELAVDRDDRYGNECLYTGQFIRSSPDAEPANDVMNCEHTWPRSRMDDEDAAPLLYSHQQSDMHHLYPTISGANSRRGNDRFGVVTRERDLSYLPAVAGLDASGNPVFEPRDERKGDVARVIFYFSVRWGKPIRDDEEVVLRAWDAADPSSARERERNDRVEALQGNRNPFIDCPGLVERIDDFAAFPILDTAENLPAP